LCESVYSFRDKEIREYMGDINYYLEQHNLENMRDVEKATVVKTTKDTSSKQSFQESKRSKKAEKQLKNRLSKVESTIATLEQEIADADAALADNFEKVSADATFFEKYQEKKDTVEKLMQEWESIQEELED